MTTVTVIIVVLVILALAAGIYVMLQNRRRADLQQRFGPEYDRAVEGASTRREAEQHLADVAQRRDELKIRDLTEAERAQYSGEWEAVQARFVDEPGQAVDSADTLISTVMRERGYPVEDFEERAELVSADHPDVVEHYREAHAAHERHRSAGGVDTEDLRQSFVHYRALFAVLVQNDDLDSATTGADRTAPVATPADVPAPADTVSGDAAPVATAPADDVPAEPASAGPTGSATVSDAAADADPHGAHTTNPQETR